VAPAQPSDSAKRKKSARRTEDGPLYSLHSFDTLLAALATRCRNRCRVKSDTNSPSFHQLTEPNPFQERAFQLLGLQ
ncbi:MAG: transposase, partial [Proteobacteria bacterium]|nr:transposase [Pseudomonadota bacterium]